MKDKQLRENIASLISICYKILLLIVVIPPALQFLGVQLPSLGIPNTVYSISVPNAADIGIIGFIFILIPLFILSFRKKVVLGEHLIKTVSFLLGYSVLLILISSAACPTPQYDVIDTSLCPMLAVFLNSIIAVNFLNAIAHIFYYFKSGKGA